jgi:hypothetical protein
MHVLIMTKRDFVVKQVGAPTAPSDVIGGSNELVDFGVTDVSKCQNVSDIFHFPIGLLLLYFFAFFAFINFCMS